MVKNHALFKKVAIGVLIVAPFVAEMAARQSPAPTEQNEDEAGNAAAAGSPSGDAPPPAPAQASAAASLPAPTAPGQQSPFSTTPPFDPTPTLDPTAFASGGTQQPPAEQPASAPAPIGPVADADVPRKESADAPQTR